MASLGDLSARVGADVSGFSTAMDQVVSKASDTVTATEQRFAAFANVGQSLAVVGAGLTATVTAPIIGMGSASLEAAGKMQQASIAFTTLLHSGDAAKTMLENLRNFAATTPFEFSELTTTAQRLLALGFAANEVIPTLQSVGNATSALGAGPEVLNRIVLALGQMRNSAHLSAGDMKQLTEAGIKGWQYLSDATGIAMADIQDKAKKVLTGAQASQIILQGMATDFAGGMEAQSKSLIGSWSNVQDKVNFALADIGKTLLPTATLIINNFVLPVLDGLRSLTEWFGNLPTPIQNMTLAAAGLVAAIGPLVLAIGGIGLAIPAVTAGLGAIATALGIGVAPMLLAAGGIAAISVALVGLGTWVADNWEPIKATLLQAWDGLTDLWMASWGPIITNLQTVWTNIGTVASTVWGAIVTFLSNLWTPVGSAVESVWNGISTFLGNVWNGISSTASTVWNGIVSVFQTFLDWAGKIPGVNKLMNLDEAWDHAKKLEKQVKNTTTAVKDHGTAHKDAKPKVEGMTTALGHVKDAHEKHTKAVKDHKQPADKFSKQALDHVEKLNDLKKKLDTAKAEQELLTTAFKNGEGPVQAMGRALDDVKVSLENIVPKFNTVQTVIGQTITPANDLNAAFKALNITSSTELKTAADNAKTHYDTIKNSGIATKSEIEAAWQAMSKAELDYRKSIGDDAPELEKALSDLKGKHETHRDQVKSVWGDIKAGIDNAIGTFGGNLKGIIGGLFTGDLSIGKLGEAFKNLGLDIADVFLNKAANAIATFVTDHIGSLMTGLGNLLSKIPLIGDALGAVFGVGSGAASAAGGAAGAAGSAAGGAGGAAGQAAGAASSSISGMVTAISSVVSALASVGQLFVGFQQEGSLNAIEHNTRYSMMYLGEHGGTSIMDILFKIQELVWYGPLVKAVESIRDSMFMQYALPNLDSIKDSAYWTLQKVDEIRQMMTEPLAFGGGAVASGAGGIAVHIDLRGSTISSDAAARDLADRVAASVTDRLQKELR